MIQYDEKGLPSIFIHGHEYYFTAMWGVGKKIDTGDYAEKKKGELILLITKKDKKVIAIKP